MGAFGAAWVAFSFPEAPALLLIPMMLLAGFLCGGLWAMIPALLKAKWHTSETLVTPVSYTHLFFSLGGQLIQGGKGVAFAFPGFNELIENIGIGGAGIVQQDDRPAVRARQQLVKGLVTGRLIVLQPIQMCIRDRARGQARQQAHTSS